MISQQAGILNELTLKYEGLQDKYTTDKKLLSAQIDQLGASLALKTTQLQDSQRVIAKLESKLEEPHQQTGFVNVVAQFLQPTFIANKETQTFYIKAETSQESECQTESGEWREFAEYNRLVNEIKEKELHIQSLGVEIGNLVERVYNAEEQLNN